jgi:hypothetical protein
MRFLRFSSQFTILAGYDPAIYYSLSPGGRGEGEGGLPTDRQGTDIAMQDLTLMVRHEEGKRVLAPVFSQRRKES